MLKINDLHFQFGQKKVLNNIDFTCEKGKIYGILGLNGAGKTTLFRSIFGYYQPQSGNIFWDEKPITKKDVAFLETENYFYPYTKGIEHLQLATNLQIDEKSLTNWQSILDLPLHDFIDNYSTGMRKKIAFLAAVLQNKPVLILDEPFNGIDLESSEKLYIILDKLRASGKVILISSHIFSSLTSVCDAMIELEEGSVKGIYQRQDFEALSTKIKQNVQAKIAEELDGIDFGL